MWYPPPRLDLVGLLQRDPDGFARTVGALRPADIAAAVLDMEPGAAARVVRALPPEIAASVLDEPELEGHRCPIILALGPAEGGPLIDAMSADQQADLFREVPAAQRPELLAAVSPTTRQTMEMLLRYSPDTAGGIMTTEVISMPEDTLVGDALDQIAAVANQRETVYAIYITAGGTNQLARAVSLQQLMTADRHATIGSVGPPRAPLAVRTDTPRDEVAQLISRYNLLAIPVIDEGGHLLGIVTVDDVLDELVREQTRSAQRFGGVAPLDKPYPEIGFAEMVRKRAGWLCALFLGEMLTATAMGHFEGEIAKAVVLALFIPLIISSGGNSGSQATSLIIRALALDELKLGDWWRIALRELPTGLTLGSILGIIGVVRILLWQHAGWYDYGVHYQLVAITVGVALVGVVTFGSLTGSLLPFLLRGIGFDPATASAPFVATLVDVTGLVIYFTIAYLILRGTLL